ncbi:MAG: hypothetical protein JW801_04595 [Bacteroidales bacterium]|nr:hypothetical protein [Bacteroidales bacterium]
MKIKILLIAGVVFFSASSFLQEKTIEKARSLDLNLAYESDEESNEIPDYVNLVMNNKSSASVKLPDGLIVLEVRSISGGVVARFPVSEEVLHSELHGKSLCSLTLKAHETLSLRVPVRKILSGQEGSGAVILKGSSYTLNAFLTEEKDPDKLQTADKIRSNFLELELGQDAG